MKGQAKTSNGQSPHTKGQRKSKGVILWIRGRRYNKEIEL